LRLSLPAFALKHPITVVMAAISVLGFGLIAWDRIPLKFLPEIDFPFIVCFIPYPGATPEQVEREVAIPTEGEFRTIPELDRIFSRSNDDGCRIGMRFNIKTDMSTAAAEVRDRIERLKLVLPDEVDRVFLFKHNSESLPVMGFLLFQGGDEGEFVHLIRTVIKPRIERLDGVAEVQMHTSTNEPEVLVEFDQNRLRTHNIGLYEVMSVLQFANLNFSVGELLDGSTKFYVRVADEYSRPEDLAELVVSPTGLRLKDIADVGFRLRELDRHYDMDGKGGAFLLVRKESEANTVATCRAIHEELEALKADPLFAGMEEFRMFDQSELILTALNGLVAAGKLGGVMAFSVLFLFLLRVRHTLIVAFAIPLSLVTALVVMFFLGMTLNVVTMVSLIVAVGMLVDNAIVVLENVYRYFELGVDRQESARRGASEVAVAIVAATLTTVVVFIPVIYMEGGDLAVQMSQFAIPFTAALFASLLVALTLIPLATSHLGPRHETRAYRLWLRFKRSRGWDRPRERPRPWWLKAFGVHPFTWVTLGYCRVLAVAVRRRLATVVILAALLVLTYFLPYQRVGFSEMPALDLRQINMKVEFDQNFDMAMAEETFDKLKSVLAEQREELDIKNVFSWYRASRGELEAYLLEPEDYPPGYTPTYSTDEVLEILSERLPKRLPGVELSLYIPESGEEGEQAKTVSVRLRGDDATQLAQYAERFRLLMANVPDLSEVNVSTERAKQEVQLKIDEPRAEQAGISPMVIARTVDVALRGNRLPYLKQSGREFPVWAQFQEENRKTRDNLDNVAVVGREGALVPLNQLVNYGKAESPTTIHRVDGKNVVTVSARLETDDLTKVYRDLRRVIASFDLPLGYTADLGDTFRDMEINLSNFWTSLFLGVVLIYIVMCALFESLLLPVSIMMSVVLAFVGAYWGLFFTQTPLDTIGMIGCILMVGVVVNNGIVIVDHINFLRIEGKDRLAAVLQGGRDRFRPVMMTALTTILACVPLAIAPPPGTTISFVSLGRALIGGLITGTALTLVIVPMLYTIIDDLRQWTSRYFANLARLRGKSAKHLSDSPLGTS